MEENKVMDFKTYYVRSQRLAGYLMLKGFVLHAIKPANDKSKRNVFCFKNTDELVNSIKEYKTNKEMLTNGNFRSN